MTFRTFSLLILISLGYLATDIYLPSLPAIGEDFRASDGVVQLTMFSYMLSFAMTPLIFGPLSDQIGRKKVIFIGLFILMAGTLGCMASASISWLIFFRLVQGIGGGAIIISSRAMIPDLHSGVNIAKQLTQITMMMPLALALGPLLGGYLQLQFGWRSVFVFLFFYELLILLKMRFVDESLKIFSEKKISHAVESYKKLLSNKMFLIVSAGMVFPSVGLFSYLAVSSFLFQDLLGLSPFIYGSLSLFIGGSVMLSSFINRRLLDHHPVEKLLWAGVCVMALAGLLLLCVYLTDFVSPVTLLIPVLMYFSCLPLCISNSVSKTMTLIESSYGSASALITTSQFLAGSLGILIFTTLEQDSVLPLAMCFLVVSALTGGVFYCAEAFQKKKSE